MKSLLKIFIAMLVFSSLSFTQEKVQLNTNIDLVSRYIWRGLDIASTPSIQPLISFSFQNISLGIWGAYTLSNQTSAADEIDIWLSYILNLGDITLSPLITDYYYPNAGRSVLNFEDGSGAHLFEAGLKISKKDFPVTITGYYNFYNESGNNTYFEIFYSIYIDQIKFDSFIGAAGGSKKNSLFYNSENFNVINIGIKATKQITISDGFILPVFASVVFNPRNEIANVIAGISL